MRDDEVKIGLLRGAGIAAQALCGAPDAGQRVSDFVGKVFDDVAIVFGLALAFFDAGDVLRAAHGVYGKKMALAGDDVDGEINGDFAAGFQEVQGGAADDEGMAAAVFQ